MTNKQAHPLTCHNTLNSPHTPKENFDADTTLTAFTQKTLTEKKLKLYPTQEQALLALALDQNVVLATPTGTGKSLVALGAHHLTLARGGRTIYTAPIKALVSEKFFELIQEFGPEKVGMLTGDAAINPTAPVICATAEVLANIVLQDRDAAKITQIVMDEFHFYGDRERGWAWQTPLLLLPAAQYLLMSATLGDMHEIGAALKHASGREIEYVTAQPRPVPLNFKYEKLPVLQVLELLLREQATPAYIVHFSQAEASEQAQALSSITLADREQKALIKKAIGDFRFERGFGQTLSRLLPLGIGIHHAGMLPKYRRLVEKLAQRGLLRVICGTDTLGVGINVPIRTVLFTGLAKYDGHKTRRLTAREFHQIAGRAGRAGFDTEGHVIALAPPHEIENAVQATKNAARIKAGRTANKTRPKQPAQGTVSWSSKTLENLTAAEPEPLKSRMQMTHAIMLGILSRGEKTPGEALKTIRTLIFESHENKPRKYELARQAIAIYRTLRTSGTVQLTPQTSTQKTQLHRITVELQADFALNQPLSPFAIAALELLDRKDPSYPLNAISLFEATLEGPKQILRAQLQAARDEEAARLRAEDIGYEERMNRLAEITYPKPLNKLVEEAYTVYVRDVPWARDFEPQPKSIVREMIEKAMTFRDFVSNYSLARSEGVVLRYLSSAYRALNQTLPETFRTPQLTEHIEWLGATVRDTDSSLIEEWENLHALTVKTDA